MAKEKLKVRGFLRGQIVDAKTGKIVGDSGWTKNVVTNEGLTNIARLIAGVAGSYAVDYAAIGTGGAVNVTHTALPGVENEYAAITPSTLGTCSAQFTASFAGSDNSDTLTVDNAGIMKTNSAGSFVAGQSFTGSQMTTDQNFNLTYQLRFATA